MKVELAPATQANLADTGSFTVVLANGQRRIKSDWNFVDENLARLIRIVESA